MALSAIRWVYVVPQISAASGKSLLPIQATHFMLYSWLPFDRNQFFAGFPPATLRVAPPKSAAAELFRVGMRAGHKADFAEAFNFASRGESQRRPPGNHRTADETLQALTSQVSGSH